MGVRRWVHLARSHQSHLAVHQYVQQVSGRDASRSRRLTRRVPILLSLASADKNGFLFLRAISALGAALTIPAATNLIINLFPDPAEQVSRSPGSGGGRPKIADTLALSQAIAIAIFGGSGAIANIIGLIVGGALLIADYRWVRPGSVYLKRSPSR